MSKSKQETTDKDILLSGVTRDKFGEKAFDYMADNAGTIKRVWEQILGSAETVVSAQALVLRSALHALESLFQSHRPEDSEENSKAIRRLKAIFMETLFGMYLSSIGLDRANVGPGQKYSKRGDVPGWKTFPAYGSKAFTIALSAKVPIEQVFDCAAWGKAEEQVKPALFSTLYAMATAKDETGNEPLTVSIKVVDKDSVISAATLVETIATKVPGGIAYLDALVAAVSALKASAKAAEQAKAEAIAKAEQALVEQAKAEQVAKAERAEQAKLAEQAKANREQEAKAAKAKVTASKARATKAARASTKAAKVGKTVAEQNILESR